jgi:hypothetical protein
MVDVRQYLANNRIQTERSGGMIGKHGGVCQEMELPNEILVYVEISNKNLMQVKVIDI